MEIQNGTTQYERTSTVFAAATNGLCTPTSWRMGAKETDFHDIYTCTTCKIETTTCAQPHSKSSGLHTCTLSSFPSPIRSFYGVWEQGYYLHAPGSPTYLISIQGTYVVNSNFHCDIVTRLDGGGRNTKFRVFELSE